MALTGLPYYGHCPFTRKTLPDGSAVETLGEGFMTPSIISYQGQPASEQQDLWAGDRVEESDNGGVTGTLSIALSRLMVEQEALITGCTVDDSGKMTMQGVPNPPYCRSGALARMKVDNVEVFRVVVYMSVKYAPIQDSFTTKTQTPAFGNHPLTGNLSANADNEVIIKQDFESLDEALVLFRTLLNVPPPVATPVADPPAGMIGSKATITLTSDEGAEIYFSIDGSEVSMAKSTLYDPENPPIAEKPFTLKARAYDPDGKKGSSAQLVAEYTITAPTPVADPPAGGIVTGGTVTLTVTDPAAAIYYTLDGTEPTKEAGTLYAAPIAVDAAESIKAISFMTLEEEVASEVLTAAYTLIANAPTATPPAGELADAKQTVALACADTSAKIYYTVDGSEPTIATGTLYATAIPVTAAMTITAKAYLTTEEASGSKTLVAEYTIKAAALRR